MQVCVCAHVCTCVYFYEYVSAQAYLSVTVREKVRKESLY